MDRRQLIRLAAGAGAAAALSPARTMAQSFNPPPEFARLDTSPRRLIRAVAGLRPFREAGYVVRAERFDRRKTLVHHYGHGGAGITMSWGTTAEAINAMLAATSERTVAVIGCGVIGLTTGLQLARRGMDVTIYAEQMPPHTTSNIAGAIWGPASLYRHHAVDEGWTARFHAAARISQREFQHYVNDPRYGVYWTRTFNFNRREPSGPFEYGPIDDLYPGMVQHRDPGRWFGYPSVDEYHCLMIDPDIYLRALVSDFETAGGRIALTRFDDPGQISRLSERVVFNCAGLGARALFGDEDLRPMRGQLAVLLPQDDIDYAYITGSEQGSLYMFPRKGAIVLGGTNELDVWETEAQPEEVARLLAGHGEVARRISG
jgi:glycine/D-amino acid oxidase-like deaminating enzyme